MSSSKLSNVAITTGIALITSIILGVGVRYYYNNSEKNRKKKVNNNNNNDDNSYEYYPPLPNPVVTLLMASRLCFLATQSSNDPHLSLMNFTYYQPEEILIMTTRRNTKKFEQMITNNKVAVLIHDFPNLDIDKNKTNGNTVSITLNGFSNIIHDENIAIKYRNIHLQKNPDYAQFIEGNEVIIIRIEKARICDINDQVKHWDAKSAIA